MTLRKIVLALVALTMSITVGAQNTDKIYDEAKALYDAKDYKAALPKLRAAAEKGHKKAQYRLGRCYDKGHGVAEDNKVAFEWAGGGDAHPEEEGRGDNRSCQRCHFGHTR